MPDGQSESLVHDSAQYATTQKNCTNPVFAASLPDGSDLTPATLCSLPVGNRDPSLVYYLIIGGVPWQLLAQDPFNLRAEHGPSLFNATHRVVLSGTYALPNTRHLQLLFGGWQVNTIMNFASASSIKPALRSASIDICLPGKASKVKRAVTSEIRTAP